MQCPGKDCGSSNVESLSHYWESLPGDSPLKGRYAPPAAPETRARLIGAGVAVLGVLLAVTGQVAGGLLVLLGGGVGAWMAHGRIVTAEADRAAWSRKLLCRACELQWVP